MIANGIKFVHVLYFFAELFLGLHHSYLLISDINRSEMIIIKIENCIVVVLLSKLDACFYGYIFGFRLGTFNAQI